MPSEIQRSSDPRSLGQTPGNCTIECRGRCRTEGRQRRRIETQDRCREGGARARFEGPSSRGRLVQENAEREDVRPGIGIEAFDLLGSHVRIGPQHRAVFGQTRALGCRGGVRILIGVPHFREAEVEQLGAFRRHHDVARLQVPVRDTASVSRVERVGDLDGEGERARQGQGT